MSLVPVSGTTAFDRVVRSKRFWFIDKSLFIKDFIEDPGQVSLILRPRRFGKSLNLSMLQHFLDINGDPTLFEGLKISSYKKIMDEHNCRYPVIKLDFHGLKGNTWPAMFTQFVRQFKIMLRVNHGLELLHLGISEADEKDENVMNTVLYELIYFLSQYHDQRVIVLIDEYDTPLNHAFMKKFYEQASSFFGFH